jgi:hypothetical protein
MKNEKVKMTGVVGGRLYLLPIMGFRGKGSP